MMNINHKCFLLTIIAVSILFILPARVFAESSSTTYEAQIITTSSAGVFTVISSTYDGQGSIGQLVIGTAGSSASGEGALGLDLGLGFLWVAGGGLAVTPQEYDICDLKAYSYATKEEIVASTWQKRNDPYFTWKMKIAYENTVVLGYSVAIDAEPDEIIDTKDLSYSGFISPPIADGKHTFSVKAATTGGLWGETEKIEFWVDTRSPQASNLSPATGEVVSDNKHVLSLDLSDSSSGINASTINLYIDNGSLDFEFKDGHLTATPDTPYTDGNITAHIKATDMAGNTLDMAWGFIVDATAPTGSIIINGGEEATSYARVRLNIEAQDETTEVVEMIISNDGIFDDEEWEDLQALRTDWILGDPQQKGIKTVYCMFKDEAENISSVYKDDIILSNALIDTIITIGPYSPTKETGAQFKYQSTFEDALFSYKLDTGEWSDWSSLAEMNLSGLEPGNHIFSVKSGKDVNGDEEITEEEEDPIPAQWTWIVQTEEELQKKERTLYWKTQ